MIQLSKSTYCKGIQCPKILWLDKHMPEAGISSASDSVLETGNKIGELARQYFGAYKLVTFNSGLTGMLDQTKQYIAGGESLIAEASFAINNLFCAVDLLRKTSTGWDIIEVKSSTKVSDIYIEDMAFQNYVLTECGINVNGIYNLHINSEYVRQGGLDLQHLFVLEDYTDCCKAKYAEVASNIAMIQSTADVVNEPVRDIDTYCETPYECSYKAYCGKFLPENSVFKIGGLQNRTKYKFYKQGLISFEDILKARPKLNASQKRQIEATVTHAPDYIDKAKIKAFLDSISYPVYHLDFETYQTPVPEYDSTKPYQQIPFQYSLHIEQADGTLVHREFLGKEGTDPRRALAESLVNDIPANAFCLAFNMSFEKGRLKELGDLFPDLSEHLLSIRDNMHDLMIPFKNQDYYAEAMHGSYSIKKVLPALCPGDPELDYHNLDGVHNGAEASAAFADLANHTDEEIQSIRTNLLKYCGLDTLAMVKILAKLRSSI